MSDMIAKNPEVPYLYRAYGTRGNYLKKHSRPDEAIQDYTKAIDLKPDNSSAYANRAFLNMDRQNWSAVISDADIAIKLNFRSPMIYQIRAVAKYYLNDLKGALTDCNKCLELDPSIHQINELRDAIQDSIQKYPGR
jgi:tetratricopeptide (TPR) repeat protein